MPKDSGTTSEQLFVLDLAGSTFSFRAKAFCLLWVNGTIQASEGSIRVRDGQIEATGSAEAATLATGVKPRDWHLRHRHYLNVAEHSVITLSIPPTPIGAGETVATLTARGRTVQVPLAQESFDISPAGELRARLTGTFDRTGLGMLPRFAGVSRQVQLTFDVIARS